MHEPYAEALRCFAALFFYKKDIAALVTQHSFKARLLLCLRTEHFLLLNLLAEIHYLQFLSLSLCVGDKGVISSKKQRKGCKTSCVFLLNTALLGF